MQQFIVCGNETIAERLSDKAKILSYKSGAKIINQSGKDDDLLLILVGKFCIEVNGSPVAYRGAAEHVGDMALIDSLKWTLLCGPKTTAS